MPEKVTSAAACLGTLRFKRYVFFLVWGIARNANGQADRWGRGGVRRGCCVSCCCSVSAACGPSRLYISCAWPICRSAAQTLLRERMLLGHLTRPMPPQAAPLTARLLRHLRACPVFEIRCRREGCLCRGMPRTMVGMIGVAGSGGRVWQLLGQGHALISEWVVVARGL